MAKKNSISIGSPRILIQIAVALFFISLGIVEIIAYNSDANEFVRSVTKAFGGKNDVINIIIAILELVSGIIILGSIFIPVKKKVLFIATFAIGIFWLVKIIIYFFINNFFEPNFFIWLNGISVDLLVLASVWMVNRSS